MRFAAQSLLLALMVLEDLSLSRDMPWNRRDASSSTRRRMACAHTRHTSHVGRRRERRARVTSISLKCSCVQMSGGASWMTGSPLSSALQYLQALRQIKAKKGFSFGAAVAGAYSPLSKSALDRKPRSSCSLSSLLNDSRVSLFLTISMPQKNPAPLMSPTMGIS